MATTIALTNSGDKIQVIVDGGQPEGKGREDINWRFLTDTNLEWNIAGIKIIRTLAQTTILGAVPADKPAALTALATLFLKPGSDADTLSSAIPLTYAQLHDLIETSPGSIVAGQKYLITNKGDKGIIVTGAADGYYFEPEAIGGFLNADFQLAGNYDDVPSLTFLPIGTKQGIWSATIEGSSAIGDMFIWNNQHYQRYTDTVDGTNPQTNATAYIQILRGAAAKVGYIEEWDNIIYDFNTDIILWRMDKRNNKINNASLDVWDWGNDMSKSCRQETYDCLVEALNNSGEISSILQIGASSEIRIRNNAGSIFIDLRGSQMLINCNNNLGDLELHLEGADANIQGDNNAGPVDIHVYGNSIISFNGNTGQISGRYADGANWNYDNNTETWENVDATNGSAGFWEDRILYGGEGGAKSKYLQIGSYQEWNIKRVANNLPRNQFVFINNNDDYTGTDLGIRIFCETKNQFALRASGGFLNPDYQGVGDYSSRGLHGDPYTGTKRGIWRAADEGGYDELDIAIWNGSHYQLVIKDNLTGGAPDSYAANPSNPWALLDRTVANVGYIEEWDDIEYIFDFNKIINRKDRRGNDISGAHLDAFQWGRDTTTNNVVNCDSQFICLNSPAAKIENNIISNLSSVNLDTLTNVFRRNIIDANTSITGLSSNVITACSFHRCVADFTGDTSSYSGKTLSPYLSTFDAEYSLIEVGNIADVPDYIGIVAVNSANPIYSIVDFTNTPTFKRKLYATNSDVMFDNSVRLRFPTPSTGTTINGNNLDFVEFLWSAVANKFIQTASEQY